MDLPILNQRIKELINYFAKGNVSEFSRQIGHSSQKINRLFKIDPRNNKFPDPSLDIMQSIENTFPKLNSSWLYKGEGKMLKSNLNEAIEKDIEDFIKVPLVPIRGKAGYLTGYGDPEYIESLPRIPVIVDRTYHGKYRCFEAEGDSMDDGSRNAICDRDIVLGREVKRELWRSKLHYRDWNFIIVHQDGITIKSITNHDLEKGTITCHSLNPLYDDFELNLDQVKELYNLIKIVDRSARK